MSSIERGPIRVLHVLPVLALGGAALGTMELVQEMNRRDDLSANCLILGHRPKTCSVSPPHTRFLGISLQFRPSIAVDLWRYRSVLLAEAPDLVHVHLWPAVWATAVAMIGVKRPLIVAHVRDTPDSFAIGGARSWFRRLLLRLSLGRAAATIAVSSAAARFTQAHLRLDRDPRVVLNAIDLRGYERVGEESDIRPDTVIGAAGRFAPEKNYEMLIEAVGILRQRGVSVVLRLVGIGRMEHRYRGLIAEQGLEGCVSIEAPKSDMADFYRQIQIFAHTAAAREGLPRVIMEALASGLPVVTTACSGAAEAVTAGDDGVVLPLSASPEQLAEALRDLIENPEKRLQFGRHARSNAYRKFDLRRAVDELTAIYREVLHA